MEVAVKYLKELKAGQAPQTPVSAQPPAHVPAPVQAPQPAPVQAPQPAPEPGPEPAPVSADDDDSEYKELKIFAKALKMELPVLAEAEDSLFKEAFSLLPEKYNNVAFKMQCHYQRKRFMEAQGVDDSEHLPKAGGGGDDGDERASKKTSGAGGSKFFDLEEKLQYEKGLELRIFF